MGLLCVCTDLPPCFYSPQKRGGLITREPKPQCALCSRHSKPLSAAEALQGIVDRHHCAPQ